MSQKCKETLTWEVVSAVVLIASLLTLCVCTPLHVEQNSVTCVYDNVTYEAGEEFKPEPCLFCHCPRHGNGQAQCVIQDCMYEPNCVKFEKKTESDCCGACVQIGCQHSDGKIYSPGSVIVDNDCERCLCPKGGGKPFCEKNNCPDINCVDYVQEPGDCCPKCLNGANCYLGKRILKAEEVVQVGRCMICHCPPGPQPFWIQRKGIQAVCTIGDCS